jgi:hypothetical protein
VFYVEPAFGQGKNIEGWGKTHGMWFVHHMAKVGPIYNLTTIEYNALIFLQFNTTYPVI